MERLGEERERERIKSKLAKNFKVTRKLYKRTSGGSRRLSPAPIQTINRKVIFLLVYSKRCHVEVEGQRVLDDVVV